MKPSPFPRTCTREEQGSKLSRRPTARAIAHAPKTAVRKTSRKFGRCCCASRAITPTPAEITQLWGMVSHDNYESFVIAHARAALLSRPQPSPPGKQESARVSALSACTGTCTTCPPSCAGGPSGGLHEAQELHAIEPLVRSARYARRYASNDVVNKRRLTAW